MSSINNLGKEKEILCKTALEIIEISKKKINVAGNTNIAESYYQKSTLTSELNPYSFDTIMALRNELNELWKDKPDLQKFIPVVLAATFKLRPKTDEEGIVCIEHKDEKDDGILPVYTYTL